MKGRRKEKEKDGVNDMTEVAGRGNERRSLGGTTKGVSGGVRQKPHHAEVMKGDIYATFGAKISAESP